MSKTKRNIWLTLNSSVIVVMTAILLSCSTQKISDLSYLDKGDLKIEEEPKLDVITQDKNPDQLKPVLIFVHGGNWNSGDKDTYTYMGRNFARRDIVVVLPTYTTSPAASYREMTRQIARAIEWTANNIKDYGGDPKKIFLSGHSAGGHLVALATMNPEYGIDNALIKGIILNDAAGLDMAGFLEKNPPTQSQNYLTTWTDDPAQWEQASPINFITDQTPPMQIYVGSKTYESIKASNLRFLEELKKHQPNVEINYLDKSHVAMVAHLFVPWNSRFKKMKRFIDDQINN